MIQDPYKVLGVSPDASDEQIKQAYRRLAKQYHPDRNPGDAEAARKMQEVNAAYEQIKNPAKAGPTYGSSGGYGGYGGYQQSSGQYQQSAYQYIIFGRYAEALHLLAQDSNRDAQWYYLSALANDGLGNQVTAMEHIRKAVDMDPANPRYQQLLHQMEGGERNYRQRAGNFRGFTMRSSPCMSLCFFYLFQLFCCRGIFCC